LIKYTLIAPINMNPFLKLFKKSKSDSQLNVAYRILPKERMIVELYSGNISVPNIIAFKLEEAADPAYNPSYTVFANLQDCVIDKLLNDIDMYLSFISDNENLILDKGRRVRILSTANQNLFAKHFKEKYDDMVKDQGMFTSVESGLEYIAKPELLPMITAIFADLKDEFKPYWPLI